MVLGIGPSIRTAEAGRAFPLAITGRGGEPDQMSTEARVAIHAGVGLIGPALEPLSDAVVVMEGGRIIGVGRLGEVSLEEGVRTIDASHLTLMPGFIDSHVHIGFADPRDVLQRGVTTVRDLGWPPDRIFPLALRSSDEDFEGPRILAAGQMLTVAGGYPTRAAWAPPGTAAVVESPAEAAEVVDAQASRGATVIKVALNAEVGPTFDEATLKAIADAAHERHLQVTAHVYGLAELIKALDAGVNEMAHMLMSPERIPDDIITRMVDQRMVVVPTLSIRRGRDLRLAQENLKRFLDAGGTVVYGTDLGNAGPRPGIDRREISALASTGMSGRDIVMSATVVAARHLRLRDRGQITKGFAADVIAVAGRPLERPRDLCRVKVAARGTPIVSG